MTRMGGWEPPPPSEKGWQSGHGGCMFPSGATPRRQEGPVACWGQTLHGVRACGRQNACAMHMRAMADVEWTRTGPYGMDSHRI